jgi:hypothetical protein
MNKVMASHGWHELHDNPASNHFLNWAISKYDDPVLQFVVGIRPTDSSTMPSGSRMITTYRSTDRSSSSDDEGTGRGDSEGMPNSGGRYQMSQEQVREWNRPHSGGSQLHSETQAGPKSAAADNRASGFEGSSTQAGPTGKGYAREPSSPFPDLGTAAGSCEPTIQPPVNASEALAPQISDGGCGMPRRGSSESLIPVRRNQARAGRAGGQTTGASVKGKKSVRVASGHPLDTIRT